MSIAWLLSGSWGIQNPLVLGETSRGGPVVRCAHSTVNARVKALAFGQSIVLSVELLIIVYNFFNKMLQPLRC